MPAAPLPAYLTSGAYSRAHHAFLVKIHGAVSDHEEDEVIADQVKQAIGVLSTKGQSTVSRMCRFLFKHLAEPFINQSKIAETLIILLHCQSIRHDISTDFAFALLPALGLAEAGKTIYERRIGYLYLSECLPRGHELQLMLINTIRKDLSVPSTTQEILLALHTIVNLPSSDLEPAVTPLLTSKSLLRHENSAVRERTIEALRILHLSTTDSLSMSRTIGPRSFPLDMRRISRLLEQEDDPNVLRALIDLIRYLIKLGVHRIKDETERMFLVEQVVATTADGTGHLTAVRCLRTILGRSPGDGAKKLVFDWLDETLSEMRVESDKGMFFEICRLSASLAPIPSTLNGHIIRILTETLVPSSSTSVPRPNDHMFVLRCLTDLPTAMWAESLGESEMGIIMEGLNHPDATVRKQTLRLLFRLSPELTYQSFSNHLEALRTSADLSLPLNYSNDDPEAKLCAAQEETALRALEAANVVYDLTGGPRLALDWVESVEEVLIALEEARDEPHRRAVWEQGVRSALDTIEKSPSEFQTAIAEHLGLIEQSSSTLDVIRSSVLAQYAHLSEDKTAAVLSALLKDIDNANVSVQELLILACLVLCGKLSPGSRHESLKILSRVLRQMRGSRYILKRCKQILRIIDEDQIDEVVLSGANTVSTLFSRDLDLVKILVAPGRSPASSCTQCFTTQTIQRIVVCRSVPER
ncbi:armadillo-type protein [Kockovaella imperatae]|uniref:Armadillo-type protein n=1 Tax=Kockovaella imperatae TaxID=4999 RepID=A0A1Y1UF01_9TREE|nr:armadillo-type protein [Kockovaella imperatae]ORX36094.1 armadillo-type protein [Kockovaella imperatae]